MVEQALGRAIVNQLTPRETYLLLLAKYRDDGITVELIESSAQALLTYVARVVSMELQLPRLRRRGTADDRRIIAGLDEERNQAHENAISAVTKLNRLCVSAEVPPLYTGDLASRYAIADFAMRFVDETFAERIGVPDIFRK